MLADVHGFIYRWLIHGRFIFLFIAEYSLTPLGFHTDNISDNITSSSLILVNSMLDYNPFPLLLNTPSPEYSSLYREILVIGENISIVFLLNMRNRS